jgi:hypothetical protein
MDPKATQPGDVSHDEILNTVMTKLGGIEEMVEKGFDAVHARLGQGDQLFRSNDVNQAVVFRALQALLVEKASRLQVEASLDEVNEAVRGLEFREARSLSADDEDTKPNIRVKRDTVPSPPPKPEEA